MRMVGCLFCGHSAGDSLQRFPQMTAETLKSAPNRAAPAGFVFLAIVSVGGGINWPVQKLILAEWPPMAARGSSGLVAAFVLAILAIVLRQSLNVPSGAWVRIVTSGFLNIGLWVVLMGYGLTMMPASEAAIIAYTMPVWTVLLAWPILGERLTVRRIIAMALAFAGIAVLLGGSSAQASMEKLPGYALALGSAVTYALGTIFLKRFPALTVIGWGALAYNAFFQQSLGFVCWLAALHRLPASVAAIGTLIVPVIGVMASAYVLGEPLGPAQLTALALTVGGVVLAVRS
jgi:drug/metabolite transporter (DMT)-like permease